MSLPEVLDQSSDASGPAAAPRTRSFGPVLTGLGVLVAVAASFVTAILEVFLVPLRVGGTLVGVSVVLAVLANTAIVWFTVAATRSRWAVSLPALLWFFVMISASSKTTEGDLLLPANSWVSIATIFAGSIAYGVAAYRMILSRRL